MWWQWWVMSIEQWGSGSCCGRTGSWWPFSPIIILLGDELTWHLPQNKHVAILISFIIPFLPWGGVGEQGQGILPNSVMACGKTLVCVCVNIFVFKTFCGDPMCMYAFSNMFLNACLHALLYHSTSVWQVHDCGILPRREAKQAFPNLYSSVVLVLPLHAILFYCWPQSRLHSDPCFIVAVCVPVN